MGDTSVAIDDSPNHDGTGFSSSADSAIFAIAFLKAGLGHDRAAELVTTEVLMWRVGDVPTRCDEESSAGMSSM